MARNSTVVDTFASSNEHAESGVTANLFRTASERFLKSLKRVHSNLTGSLSSLRFYNDVTNREDRDDEKLDKGCDSDVVSLRPTKPKLRRPHSFAVGDNIHHNITSQKFKQRPLFLGIKIKLHELIYQKWKILLYNISSIFLQFIIDI